MGKLFSDKVAFWRRGSNLRQRRRVACKQAGSVEVVMDIEQVHGLAFSRSEKFLVLGMAVLSCLGLESL